MIRSKTLTVLALALATTLASGAGAQTAPGPAVEPTPVAPTALPASVRMLIDAIDVPLTPTTVARSGLTEAQAASLATDPAARRYTRVRAVGALGVLGTDSARRLIELLAAADPDEQVRVQAVVSLSRIWGTDDRAAVVHFLVERLGDTPPVVGEAISRELDRLYR